MSKTLKTVSALAIAAATLTAVTLANGSAASAHPLNGAPPATAVHRPSLNEAHRLPFFRMHQPVFSCLACNLPRPHPTWGNHPWRFHNCGYGYNRWYWDRYRYRYASYSTRARSRLLRRRSLLRPRLPLARRTA